MVKLHIVSNTIKGMTLSVSTGVVLHLIHTLKGGGACSLYQPLYLIQLVLHFTFTFSGLGMLLSVSLRSQFGQIGIKTLKVKQKTILKGYSVIVKISHSQVLIGNGSRKGGISASLMQEI